MIHQIITLWRGASIIINSSRSLRSHLRGSWDDVVGVLSEAFRRDCTLTNHQREYDQNSAIGDRYKFQTLQNIIASHTSFLTRLNNERHVEWKIVRCCGWICYHELAANLGEISENHGYSYSVRNKRSWVSTRVMMLPLQPDF